MKQAREERDDQGQPRGRERGEGNTVKARINLEDGKDVMEDIYKDYCSLAQEPAPVI